MLRDLIAYSFSISKSIRNPILSSLLPNEIKYLPAGRNLRRISNGILQKITQYSRPAQAKQYSQVATSTKKDHGLQVSHHPLAQTRPDQLSHHFSRTGPKNIGPVRQTHKMSLTSTSPNIAATPATGSLQATRRQAPRFSPEENRTSGLESPGGFHTRSRKAEEADRQTAPNNTPIPSPGTRSARICSRPYPTGNRTWSPGPKSFVEPYPHALFRAPRQSHSGKTTITLHPPSELNPERSINPCFLAQSNRDCKLVADRMLRTELGASARLVCHRRWCAGSGPSRAEQATRAGRTLKNRSCCTRGRSSRRCTIALPYSRQRGSRSPKPHGIRIRDTCTGIGISAW